MRKQLLRYREFIEEKLARGKLEPLPVLKQAFIGDEEFVEQAKRKAVKNVALERSYPLKRIVQAVCRAQGVEEGEIKRPGRNEEVQRAQETICYLARRHSDVGLGELTGFLGVKELSTPSHGV